MNKRNFSRETEAIIKEQESMERVPTLLLHSCCAPCSSYVLEYLSQYFEITLFYYNPNIYPPSEYEKRVNEQKKLIESQPHKYPVHMLAGRYEPSEYYEAVKGHEHDKEGGERCFLCYDMRLSKTAAEAAEGGFDYFTTTLSISPLKNAEKLNELGEAAAERYHVRYLPSDFKKKDGYKRSIELSKEYGLYRQNYCGCIFSQEENIEGD